jgi:hypothetical protein
MRVTWRWANGIEDRWWIECVGLFPKGRAMADRLNPSHDRVRLTGEELRSLEHIEQALTTDRVAETAPVAEAPFGSQSARPRWFAHWRLLGVAPWLVPIGLVVLVSGLWSAALAIDFGAALAVIGIAACMWRAWRGSQLERECRDGRCAETCRGA